MVRFLLGLLLMLEFFNVHGESLDVISEAKKHYQNATTAIDKSDWATAKTELQISSKLVPTNALVHYDLALAYSHLGDRSSAQNELHKAVELGLPPAQKHAADELAARPQSAPTTQPVPETNSSSTSHVDTVPASVQGSAVHTLNGIIKNELGATTNAYRPFNFTLETSTRKLWWSRVTNSYCKGGGAAMAQAGAKLSELDAGTVRTGTDTSGNSELLIGCKNGFACIEDWSSPTCAAMSDFTNAGVSAIESMPKSSLVNHKSQPMTFMGKLWQLEILTTGDPDASDKAIRILSQLITKAGAPSQAYLAEGERQQAAASAEQQRQQREKQRIEKETDEKINAQLAPLVGRWHSRSGEKMTRSGQMSSWQIGQSMPGKVDYWLRADHDITIGEPTNGEASGVYTISNYEGTIAKSGMVTTDYYCFNVGAQCYPSYSWNKTQTYDVKASVHLGDRLEDVFKFTHRACQGDCSQDSMHMPDKVPRMRLESPYVMYIDGDKYYKQ